MLRKSWELLLPKEGAQLVYGGGNVGLMGVVATAALKAGGEVIGVIPGDLMRREVGFLGSHQIACSRFDARAQGDDVRAFGRFSSASRRARDI